MRKIVVPYDQWAEEAVVACAIASDRAARLAENRVEVRDIWCPWARRLYEAALALDPSLDLNARIEAAAVEAAVDVRRVRTLVEDRPVMCDVSGGFARRVADTARRRTLMTIAARLYNELGHGARLEDVAAEVRQIESALP
jgi:hypothetical protein